MNHKEPLVSTATVTAGSSEELAKPPTDDPSQDTAAATLPSDEAQGNSSSAQPSADCSLEDNVVDLSCETVAPDTQDAAHMDFIPLGSLGDSDEELLEALDVPCEEVEPKEVEGITPSYLPEGEDLLYEGDMDLDPGQAPLEEPKEEGFIVDLHDTSMDLEFSGNKSASQMSSAKVAASNSSGGNAAAEEKSDGLLSKESLKKSPTARFV